MLIVMHFSQCIHDPVRTDLQPTWETLVWRTLKDLEIKSNKLHPSSFYYSKASCTSQCADIKLALQALGWSGQVALNNELPQSKIWSSWCFITLAQITICRCVNKQNNNALFIQIFFSFFRVHAPFLYITE